MIAYPLYQLDIYAINEPASYYAKIYSNVALGTKALYLSTVKSNLVAVGDIALYKNGQDATSEQAILNIAIGSKVLSANTSSVGSFNYSSGAYSATSDRRLKETIQPMKPVLADVMKLQADEYTYIADPEQKPCLGFIAQEVEPLFPQLITPPINDGKGKTPYMMNYSGFGVLAIKAIQEQQTIIDAQEVRIAKLESLVQELIAKEN